MTSDFAQKNSIREKILIPKTLTLTWNYGEGLTISNLNIRHAQKQFLSAFMEKILFVYTGYYSPHHQKQNL